MKIIDLFNRGSGMLCLKSIYSLSDEIINELDRDLFNYEEQPPTDEKVEEIVLGIKEILNETEESICCTRQWLKDCSRLKRYPKPNCVKRFLGETGIYPEMYNLADVKIRLRHLTSVIDDGESIKKNGLLRLDELLEYASPLSNFLKNEGIVISPMYHTIVVDGKVYSIDNNENIFGVLSSKLYDDLGEIEMFVCASDEEMIGYSWIQQGPEILYTLDRIFKGRNLLKKWNEKATKLLVLEVDVGFDECIIHSMANCHCEFEPHNDDTSEIIVRNHWVIDRCLNNSSRKVEMREEYAAIKPEVRITSNMIRIRDITDKRTK